MKVKFWGVRGSIPTPITPQQIQSKIMAVVQRITAKDLESTDAKAKFIANLPDWLYGTTGGNTPCVELLADNKSLIFDAGSGIRDLGKNLSNPTQNEFYLFFSHFHWDHIQGLPFFDPVYNPNNTFNVYSVHENPKNVLSEQMIQPYFPVTFEAFTKKFNFNKVETGKEFKIGNITINACKMSHPGDSYSYSFECDNKKFVYATDVELEAKDFSTNNDLEKVFKNADCIVLDSQYTVEEAYRKVNWGHSAFCYAIDFAVNWNIKKLYLFHHEPTYDDKKLNSILQAARWYAQYIEHSDIQIYLAKEGEEVIL